MKRFIRNLLYLWVFGLWQFTHAEGFLSRAEKNELDTKVGINILSYTHATHLAVSANSSGPAVAFYYEGKNIFSNHIFYGSNASVGSSPSNINHAYHLVGMNNLTTYRPRGGTNLDIDLTLRLGYDVLRREYDTPFALSLGIRMLTNSTLSSLSPTFPQLTSFYANIEASGLIALQPKLDFEYFIAFSPLLNASVNVPKTDNILEGRRLKITEGYGISLALGTRYYVSNKAYFFAQIIASYTHWGQSSTGRITTAPTTTEQVILPNVSTDVYYPASHTTQAGIRIGYGF
ncbi:hypothetical protein LS71_001940 [Helicobacter jaachi]|uniref:Uncharacterized protein n=1 Tax=Helicobacter jaachi TaxID=1677920 RepID=A0A4U8TC48_9HELI|nr:hypothetical protein [Helicobacter jaachi]TLD97530.1 hypothetical protein LS71_001940 [Helicobacter jaachi]